MISTKSNVKKTNPIKANSNPIKPNSNPNKPNSMPYINALTTKFPEEIPPKPSILTDTVKRNIEAIAEIVMEAAIKFGCQGQFPAVSSDIWCCPLSE